jgi:2-oxoglutaroyl-CoA hydrolase
MTPLSPQAIPTQHRQFDGFKMRVDRAAQRADIVLDRPPYNVISMRARDEVRRLFCSWIAMPM